MSTEQQQHYASNTHVQNAQFYPQQDPMVRNPMAYGQQTRMPYVNQQMVNAYPQQMYFPTPQYLPNGQFVISGPRFSGPTPIRSQNEIAAAAAYNPNPYASAASYAYVQSGTPYNPQGYSYGAPSATIPMHQPGAQPAVQMANTMSQQAGMQSTDQSQAMSTVPPPQLEKRARKPLRIIDPSSKKDVEIEKPANVEENRPKEALNPNPPAPTVAHGQEKRDAFVKDFAKIFSQPANKDSNATTHEEPKDDKPVEIPENESLTTTSSVDESIPNPIEDKSDNVEEAKDIEPISDQGQATPEVQNDEAVSSESEQSPTNTSDTESSRPLEKTPSGSKRTSYSISELLKKRTDPLSQVRPSNLRHIEGVTNQRPPGGNVNPFGSYDRSSNAPSRDSITLERPAFQNRSDNPYVRADQNRLDALNKFLRDVKAILNKVTPQTYDKLLKQLEELELTSDQRLEGMITIIFGKAVDEPSFCSLYANICKHFQRKQVTVPNKDGQMTTHMFRQILLTRCQKEFENDYRQEIEYEKRQKEVEEIADEKAQKEASEKLEEDLGKAKRKKLGNIYFIGELFKLQMLTDTIMYDCIEYLLRDKSDEESLECLCRLLRTIGQALDAKASEKASNKSNLEKQYRELETIVQQRQTSARMRFMIQDLLEQRRASWVARHAEIKPVKIDEIHQEARAKREQEERDQERERQQRRENRGQGNNPQQYSESRGSRGSGMRQQGNRNDDERSEPRFNVNSVRQLQTNDKRNQGTMPLNLAPQRAWAKGSGIDKKAEDDRSFAARAAAKPPMLSNQSSKSKTNPSSGPAPYGYQNQSSRELARENSQRDRAEAMDSFRRTTNGSVWNNSRESSRNVSREQSRNASRESSVTGRQSSLDTESTSNRVAAATTATADSSATPFDEEKTQTRVRSLIEEFTENYSENSERPVKEALEDLADFCTSNDEHQSIIVRELFSNVLEAKPRARKAVGHLLDAAFHEKIFSADSVLKGVKMIIEIAPDMAVDIPLIWQCIGEILGAFIGAPSSNMFMLKDILSVVPEDKSKQFFQYVIRFASEFSSKAHLQRHWQSSGLTLNDLFSSETLDPSFVNQYDWLNETVRDKNSPSADPKLVNLFKSFKAPGDAVPDAEILAYIKDNMNENDKFYIRNIVLSYLEACLVNGKQQTKMQEDIARTRMAVLSKIIEHKPEAEIQAIYAIQNFVHRLEHPHKMAQLLFDIFYDGDCVSEEAFFDWSKNPDPAESEGHSIVVMSTKDFFTWLKEADAEEDDS